MKTKTLTLIGLMTALICVISPFSLSIPVSPVPITFSLLAIYLTVYILGMKKGTISCLLYILIGLVGIPVFSGFSAGPGKLLGPTGGYIIGYIFSCLICGYFIDKFRDKWYLSFLGMALGTLCCYLFGTAWLAYSMELTFFKALAIGVLPYIPADLVKIAVVLLIGYPIRKALVKAHLL